MNDAGNPAGPGLPLAGLKVIELGSVIAGPFCGSLMADLGASVIKIERPEGDPGRHLGARIDGVSVWWGVSVRDKSCAVLDLRNPDHRSLLFDLVSDADVLVENNRAGALERLGLGWEELRRRNPRLVMLSVSGFGQTGPLSAQPGFGKIAEGLSGIVPLTGDPKQNPLHVGFSLADASTSLFGLLGVMVMLWQRDCNEGIEGTQLDLGLYEGLLRMTELQAALQDTNGAPPLRRGSNDPYGWGAADGERQFVGMTCADGTEISVLIDEQTPARIKNLTGCSAMPQLALSDWAARRDCETVAADFRKAGIEAAPIQNGSMLARDPYFLARGDVRPASLPEGPDMFVPGHMLRQLGSVPLCPFRDAGLAADQEQVFPA